MQKRRDGIQDLRLCSLSILSGRFGYWESAGRRFAISDQRSVISDSLSRMTFSRKTAEENGLVIGREDRALGIDVSLQPFVNIDRDLQFGRGYNTFGEDPFLTA